MIKLKTTLKIFLVAVAAIFLFTIHHFVYLQDQTAGPALEPQQQPEVAQEQKPVEIPTPEDFLVRVNEERAKVGAAPLVIDERINKSAQRKAEDMANNDYFDHVSPVDGRSGGEYAHDNAPKVCRVVSENIQSREYGPGYSTTPVVDSAMSGWINSPSHYKAMIDTKYSLTGFGVARGPEKDDDSYNIYAVQHFCETY